MQQCRPLASVFASSLWGKGLTALGQGAFRPIFGMVVDWGAAVLQNEANCSDSTLDSMGWVFMMASRA